MPSRNQPADTSERMRCPTLVESIGEDPARWLDADLLADDDRASMVKTLIDGIDSLQRVRAWRAVERRLAARDDRDPRAPIMQRLDQREEWLKLHGERVDRLPYGPRESCDCCDADGFVTAAEIRERREDEWARRSDGYTVTGANTGEGSPETEATGLDVFATDGGEQR
jgi:hypothetical protein